MKLHKIFFITSLLVMSVVSIFAMEAPPAQSETEVVEELGNLTIKEEKSSGSFRMRDISPTAFAEMPYRPGVILQAIGTMTNKVKLCFLSTEEAVRSEITTLVFPLGIDGVQELRIDEKTKIMFVTINGKEYAAIDLKRYVQFDDEPFRSIISKEIPFNETLKFSVGINGDKAVIGMVNGTKLEDAIMWFTKDVHNTWTALDVIAFRGEYLIALGESNGNVVFSIYNAHTRKHRPFDKILFKGNKRGGVKSIFLDKLSVWVTFGQTGPTECFGRSLIEFWPA